MAKRTKTASRSTSVRPNSTAAIPLAEFAARRARVLAALGNSVGLVFAGQAKGDDFRPHPHFRYLTGITDEPGAALLLDPTNPVDSRREMLLLRPLNPEVEKWDGYRQEISAALKTRTGFKAIFRLDKLPMWLNDAAKRSRRLACLHPLSQYTQDISPDLAVFRKVAERVPGTAIEDRTAVLANLRSVKSRAEVAMIRRAIDITAKGFAAMMRSIRPGMSEFDVQETMEHAYRTNGARELSFGTIAGAGVNSTVLHYRANDQKIADGDLVCIDSGAKWNGYSADITRTVPANGTFTRRQREVYEVVLASQLAAIKAVRPGARIADVDAAARKVIDKAGFGDAFIHGIGHHLGLETHDINPDVPLKPGAVITIEPGVYLPGEKIGIRIEDDVLVRPGRARCEVLSAMIPKTVRGIEGILPL